MRNVLLITALLMSANAFATDPTEPGCQDIVGCVGDVDVTIDADFDVDSTFERGAFDIDIDADSLFEITNPNATDATINLDLDESDHSIEDSAVLRKSGNSTIEDGAIRAGNDHSTDNSIIRAGNDHSTSEDNSTVLDDAHFGNIRDNELVGVDGDVESESTSRVNMEDARIGSGNTTRSSTAQEQSAYGGESDQTQTASADNDQDLSNTIEGDELSNDVDASSTNDLENTSDNSNGVEIDQSDHSSYSSSYTYEEVYRAPNLSTQLNTTTSACINFLGLQMTGADEKGAGAMGVGFPLKDKECRLGKAAILAFQMENYQAGWTAYCAQKTVRGAFAGLLKAQGEPRRGRKAKAFTDCVGSAVDLEATRVTRLASIERELAALRAQLMIAESTDDDFDPSDLIARIAFLETAAHTPTSRTLLLGEHGHDHN